MEETKTSMVALTPQNFHTWLKELKGIAEKAKVWEYVDPNGQKQQPESADFPEISDFQVPVAPQTPVTRSAEDYEKLSDAQQKAYQMKITVYQMKEKLVDKMAHGMRLVDNAVKASARSYIPSTQMDLSTRDIIKKLTAKYQRSDDQIAEQIFDQYRSLQQPPPKQKIEKWVTE